MNPITQGLWRQLSRRASPDRYGGMDGYSPLPRRLTLVALLLITAMFIRGRAIAETGEAKPSYTYASSFGAIGVDDKHTCVVRPNGTVRCWGRDQELQLGNDAASSNSNIPVTVSGLSDVVAIGSGMQHNCVLSNGGGVQCWGDGTSGVLGRGSNTDSWSPVAVTGLSSGVNQVSVGSFHSCAVTVANGLKCWGNGSYGRLGDGTTNQRSTPVDIFPAASGVVAVSLGDVSSCALFADGSVKCWGRNSSGQLGTGDTTDALSPTLVPTLASGVVAISVGENNVLGGLASHACALLADGSVKCWGDNSAGQIGDGTTLQRLVPTAVVGLPAPAVGISAGAKHTCAVLDTGAVFCWGLNASQQLGDGTVNPRSQPTQVIGLTSGMAAVAAGSFHTCAMTTTSDVKCWGDNVYGQIGDGTNIARPQPRDVTFDDPGTLPPYTTAPPGSGGQATSSSSAGQGGSTSSDPQSTITTVPPSTSPPASSTSSTAVPNTATTTTLTATSVVTTTTTGPSNSTTTTVSIVTTAPPGTGVSSELLTTTSVRLPTVGRDSGRTTGAAWLVLVVGAGILALRRFRPTAR